MYPRNVAKNKSINQAVNPNRIVSYRLSSIVQLSFIIILSLSLSYDMKQKNNCFDIKNK